MRVESSRRLVVGWEGAMGKVGSGPLAWWGKQRPDGPQNVMSLAVVEVPTPAELQ